MKDYIDITRTMSAPSSLGVTSFLDFKPELRNMIYATLFEIEGPIIFRFWQDQDDVFDCCIYLDPAPQRFELRGSEEACSAIRASVGFLGCCRQLYHEAASVLYGHNVFVFGKLPEQHINNIWQLPMAVDWCTKLSGGSLQYLRNVIIDLDTVCLPGCTADKMLWFPSRHNTPPPQVDLGPLARLMWGGQASKCDFRFSHTETTKIRFEVELLNGFLKCLARDQADLKKYRRQIFSIRAPAFDIASLYPSVRLPRHDNGSIEFGWDGRDPNMNDLRSFYIENSGDTMRFDCLRSLSQPTFLGLPHHLRRQIFQEVWQCYKGIVLDVDNETCNGANLGLAMAYKHGYPQPRLVFLEMNKFTFRMACAEAITDFEGFEGLKQALCVERTSHYGVWAYPWASHFFPLEDQLAKHGPITIELNFKLDKEVPLEDIRIEILDLIRVTSSLNGQLTRICISVESECDWPPVGSTHEVSLHTIRCQVLHLAAQVTLSFPNFLDMSCFDVRIDGTGKARDFRSRKGLPHPFSYNNEHAEPLDDGDIEVRYGVTLDSRTMFPTFLDMGLIGAKHCKSSAFDGTLRFYLEYLKHVMEAACSLGRFMVYGQVPTDFEIARQYFKVRIVESSNQSWAQRQSPAPWSQ